MRRAVAAGHVAIALLICNLWLGVLSEESTSISIKGIHDCMREQVTWLQAWHLQLHISSRQNTCAS